MLKKEHRIVSRTWFNSGTKEEFVRQYLIIKVKTVTKGRQQNTQYLMTN